jgi:MIP family channel proteins
VQDRGSASYLAEFLGTFLLVLFISLVVSLFVQAPTQALPAPFIDWTVIGLVHAFALFLLIQTLALVSGAHFNPAVTVAMATLRQIKPADAGIYVIAQLAGAVAGALVVKLLLNNFPNAELVNYGAVGISDRLDDKLLLGGLAEMIGTFILVITIMGVAVDPRSDRALGPLVIGAALGGAVMVIGPLTGAGLNPARAFGPALVSGEWGGAGDFLVAFVLAPCIGAVLAAWCYFRLFMTPGAKGPEGLEPVG